MSTRFDEMASLLGDLLPMPRLGVIGSASCVHPDTEATCVAVGKSLASVCSLAVITGGRGGVGQVLSSSFFRTRVENHQAPNVYHLLPDGYPRPADGETLYVGPNMVERREVLGRVARVYLAIEGGPGTEYEANVALSNGAFLVPLGRSGGYSRQLFDMMSVPAGMAASDWRALAEEQIYPDKLANVVRTIVTTLLEVSK